MSRWLFEIFFVCLLLKYASNYQEKNPNEEDNSSHFPKNDFTKFLSDLWKNLGIEPILTQCGDYMRNVVRDGQYYTAKDFERDFDKVKSDPTFWNIIEFIRITTWPLIVNGCVQVINFFSQIQRFLLKFLKKKCDQYIGINAPFHPWNIMKEHDKTQISFLVFVYTLAASLIVIKIVSWWNFSVYLAFGFLAYYFGGPHLLFKWLLTFTALVWFIVDVIIHNPLQVAVIIIVLYLLSLAKTLLRFDKRSQPSAVAARKKHSGDSVPDRGEYNSLMERIDGMETKTNLLNSKLDKLSKSMERIILSENED